MTEPVLATPIYGEPATLIPRIDSADLQNRVQQVCQRNFINRGLKLCAVLMVIGVICILLSNPISQGLLIAGIVLFAIGAVVALLLLERRCNEEPMLAQNGSSLDEIPMPAQCFYRPPAPTATVIT